MFALDEGEECVEHAVDIVVDIDVPYAEDAVAEAAQISRAPLVASDFLIGAVSAAVDLDDDLALSAEEALQRKSTK